MNTTYTNHHKNDQNLKIKNQAEIILGLSGKNSLSDTNRIQIEKKLSEVITLMNEGEKIKLTTVDDINITKKIDRQIRLYSTKKKSSHKTQISKPSINETNAILSGFEDVNSESAHVHCAFDHSYDTI